MRCAPNSSSSPFTFDSVIIAGGKRKRTNEREKKKRTNRRCKRTACLVRVGRSLFSLFLRSFFVFLCARKRLQKLLKKKLHTPPSTLHTPPAAFPIKKKREKKFSPRASPFSYKSPLCTHAHAHARIFVFVYGRRTSRLKRETQTFWRERIRVRKC